MVNPDVLIRKQLATHHDHSTMKHLAPWIDGLLFKAIFAAACGATAAQSWAGLAWEKDDIDLTADIGQKIARTSYAFTNTGSSSISVISVMPSCGCVATNLEKLAYAPGERGEIQVTFDLDMDKDQLVQNRTIKVTTSDSPDAPKTLKLKVTERAAVEVSPETLVWKHGHRPTPKEVIVKAAPGIGAISLTQTAQNSNFSVELQPGTNGQRYRLKITPKNIDFPCDATVNFDVKSPSFEQRVDCEIQLKVE